VAVYLKRARVEAGEGWPFDLPAVGALGSLRFDAPATFLVGENGVGKSTLVEGLAMAAGLNAHGGTRNLRTSGHGTESPLHEQLVLSWARRPRRDFFLRAETLLDTLVAYDSLPSPDGRPVRYGGLTKVSHGESVVGLLARISGDGLLLLADEPEAGLSVTGQLAVLRRLHELVAEGAQVVCATHSPILPALPGGRVYELHDDGADEVEWADTDAVAVLRSFLGAPERYLARLLGD
jgi:predicted ATPase